MGATVLVLMVLLAGLREIAPTIPKPSARIGADRAPALTGDIPVAHPPAAVAAVANRSGQTDDAASGLSPSSHPRPNWVRRIQYSSAAGRTQIAIQTDGPPVYRSEVVSDPERIYLDLVGTRLAPGAGKLLFPSAGGVRRIRAAQYQPDVTRVVLDLSAARRHSISRTVKPAGLLILLETPDAP